MLDPLSLRTALGRYATGVTIITCAGSEAGTSIGITANSFTSVSLKPPLVSWGLALNAYSLLAFRHASHFAIHVLRADQQALAESFATRGADKFASVPVTYGLGGAPLIGPVLARFECRRHQEIEAGDHAIFIGEVVRFETWEESPLLFFSGQFQKMDRGQISEKTVVRPREVPVNTFFPP